MLHNTIPTQFTILTDEMPVFPVSVPKRFTLEAFLNRGFWNVTPVMGVFNGIKEKSFLVETVGKPRQVERMRKTLEQIARDCGQLAVLHVENGLAILSYVNGPLAGTWTTSENLKITRVRPEGDYTEIGPFFLQVTFED